MSLPARCLSYERRGCLALAVAGALALIAAPQAAAGTSIVITVRSVTLSSSQTDRGAQGPSRGDVTVVHDRLLNVAPQLGKPAGATIGSDRGDFHYTSATRFTISGVTNLPGGTVAVKSAGAVSDATAATLTVTGGTGRYAGATGTVQVVGGGNAPINVYRLVVP